MSLTLDQQQYIDNITNAFKYGLFTLTSFPSMFFWGVKVKNLSETSCQTTIKYSHRSRNPFKSLYFSALFGAAELSTGIMVQMLLQGEGKWSMLVKSAQGQFTKKALGTIIFTCDQGELLSSHIDRIKREGQGTFILESIGINEDGLEIGRYNFEWTLKFKGK